MKTKHLIIGGAALVAGFLVVRYFINKSNEEKDEGSSGFIPRAGVNRKGKGFPNQNQSQIL